MHFLKVQMAVKPLIDPLWMWQTECSSYHTGPHLSKCFLWALWQKKIRNKCVLQAFRNMLKVSEVRVFHQKSYRMNISDNLFLLIYFFLAATAQSSDVSQDGVAAGVLVVSLCLSFPRLWAYTALLEDMKNPLFKTRPEFHTMWLVLLMWDDSEGLAL